MLESGKYSFPALLHSGLLGTVCHACVQKDHSSYSVENDMPRLARGIERGLMTRGKRFPCEVHFTMHQHS